MSNAQLLLQRFEVERQALRQKLLDMRAEFSARAEASRQPLVCEAGKPNKLPRPVANVRRLAPWDWMKPLTSMAGFKLRDGSGWVRVQHKDGRQMLAPWPHFDGWDEALPAHLGIVDEGLGAIRIDDLVTAIAYLRKHSTWERVSGVWAEIAGGLNSQAPR